MDDRVLNLLPFKLVMYVLLKKKDNQMIPESSHHPVSLNVQQLRSLSYRWGKFYQSNVAGITIVG